MIVFYFTTCSHFPYLRITSYTTRDFSTSPIYVLWLSVKGRMRGLFMFPVSVTQVSVTCSWTGQSDEAAEGRLWRCRFICRNQAVTPRLIWLAEGCERVLTHADLGLLSFMAQVSIHSFILKCVMKVCKVGLIENELLHKHMMKVQGTFGLRCKLLVYIINIHDNIRNRTSDKTNLKVFLIH